MKHFLHTKDYFYSNEDFTLLHDYENDMLITEPVPLNLANYYQSKDYISHSDSAATFIDRIYHVVKTYSLKRKLRLINSLHPQKGTLLDIGAGTGNFLLTAKKSNWDITGVEPNPLARKNAKQNILPSSLT